MNAIANPSASNNLLLTKPLVIIGMPGSGKSKIGRALADYMQVPFFDSDAAIEEAAKLTIPELFRQQGEPYFREKECHVITRLLKTSPSVLSTGGGAFIHDKTRAIIEKSAITVWLKVSEAILLERIRRKDNRPMFQNVDPEAKLRELMAVREPIYQKADVTVASDDQPVEHNVERVLFALKNHLAQKSSEA